MKTPRFKVNPDYVVFVDVYHLEVGVFRTFGKWRAWHEERGIEVDERQSYGQAERAEDPDGVPWYLAYIPDDCSAYTIAHECLHIAFYILETCGVPADYQNQEAICYLQEHLFKSISEAKAMTCKKGKRRKGRK